MKLINFRYIRERETVFPAIGFCNSNPFLTNYSIEFLKDFIQDSQSIAKSQAITDLDFINEKLVNKSIVNHLWNHLFGMNRSEAKLFGFGLEDMIIDCEFNLEKCDMKNDFEWAFSYRHGNCYYYNFNGKKRIKNSGIDYKLSVVLFGGFEQTIPAFYPGKLLTKLY